MKKVLLVGLTVMCALGLVVPVFGAVRTVAGGQVSDDGTPVGQEPNATMEGTRVAPLGGSVSGTGYTGFDDMTPCYFINTFPMQKKWYKTYGVQFKGPNSLDGGAVLNECSDFGTTGQSSPNFLAFNCELTMSNGGRPVTPETIIFSPAVDAAQISIGSGIGVGELVTITAKTSDGGTVDSATVPLTSAMESVFLYGGKKIKKVIITVPQGSNACAFVVDDVYYGTP